MFHRVKSEVQDSEQQGSKQSENAYRQEAEAPVSVREEKEDTSSREKNASSRSYGRPAAEREEPQDDAVQGKYAREPEEAEAAPARSGYQPSVARPSYNSGGATSASGSSYATPSYSAPKPQQTEPLSYSSTAADRTLTIGRGINMSGEIDACDHLFVEGTVEAALKGAKALEIAESGTFYGTVEIEEAVIAGRFEGDITVNGRLTLKSTGIITGSIAYRDLEVESGAVLDGRLTPLKGTVDQKSVDEYRAGTGASAMAKTKATKGSSSKKDNREPANAERGLFSKAHASY